MHCTGGDWAGNSAVYAASGCPSDCVTYVDGEYPLTKVQYKYELPADNPTAFGNAYFQFSSIHVYT